MKWCSLGCEPELPRAADDHRDRPVLTCPPLCCNWKRVRHPVSVAGSGKATSASSVYPVAGSASGDTGRTPSFARRRASPGCRPSGRSPELAEVSVALVRRDPPVARWSKPTRGRARRWRHRRVGCPGRVPPPGRRGSSARSAHCRARRPRGRRRETPRETAVGGRESRNRAGGCSPSRAIKVSARQPRRGSTGPPRRWHLGRCPVMPLVVDERAGHVEDLPRLDENQSG